MFLIKQNDSKNDIKKTMLLLNESLVKKDLN